jgi:hypothetical protein
MIRHFLNFFTHNPDLSSVYSGYQKFRWVHWWIRLSLFENFGSISILEHDHNLERDSYICTIGFGLWRTWMALPGRSLTKSIHSIGLAIRYNGLTHVGHSNLLSDLTTIAPMHRVYQPISQFTVFFSPFWKV